MTTVHLTDEDYEVLNAGDINEIKRHVNNLRGEMIAITKPKFDLGCVFKVNCEGCVWGDMLNKRCTRGA